MIYKIDCGFMINTRDIICRGKRSGIEQKPKINKVCWSKDKVLIGKEVILRAELENQYEMAQVVFKVWNENADFNKDLPLAVIRAHSVSNKAEVKYRYNINEPFCLFKVDLTSDFIKNQFGIDDAGDTFKYMIEDYDNDFENKLKNRIKLFFTAESFRCDKVKSGFIEIGDDYEIEFNKPDCEKLKNIEYSIKEADGKKYESLKSLNGIISKKSRIPGFYQIKLKKE
ncbi:MAG: hypothetical protein JW702_04435 [Clostridiales bacterium]|nr:hypothetical protein [Clostridiales bacterium]